MRAVVLNGARDGDEATDRVGEVLADVLKRRGCQIDVVQLRDVDMADCLGCFGCWVRTPGVCVVDDKARDLAQHVVQADLMVMLTPVTFGGYSYHLKKAIDRLIGIASPFFTKVEGEVHHRPRYDRYPGLLGIGVQDEPDEEAQTLFKALVNRNAINLLTQHRASGVVTAEDAPDAIRQKVEDLVAQVEADA